MQFPWTTLPAFDNRKDSRYAPFVRRRESRLADRTRGDLLQGTLDMLVLRALQLQPMHGWGITERLEQGSARTLQVGQGSLYPALYRLERRGLITSKWDVTENNRKARYYTLTAAGRRYLAREQRLWRRMSRAVNLILEMS